MRPLTTQELVDSTPYAAELPDATAVFKRHCAHVRTRGLVGSYSTSLEDCLLLYLLIRHFGRRAVFEVGTFIGTTAVVMNAAVKRNGGTCITCDPDDHGCLPADSGI